MQSHILRSYRELLTLLKRLPATAERSEHSRAKREILRHRHEQDVIKISDLHKQLVAKVSFLRMTTTRRPGEVQRQASGTFVLRDGALVASEAETQSRYSFEQLQTECCKRALAVDMLAMIAEQLQQVSACLSSSSDITNCLKGNILAEMCRLPDQSYSRLTEKGLSRY